MTYTCTSSKKVQRDRKSNPILCYYMNTTNRLQIIRIENIPQYHLERVVFPGQRIMFEAIPEAKLEVHSHEIPSAVLSDVIPCSKLQVQE